MLTSDQICREIVDTAAARSSQRVACVMVGADLTAPMNLTEWKDEVERWLVDLLPSQEVQVELAYGSFASLGRAAQECAVLEPEWTTYADDVRTQLHLKGLLGYDGAPMLDDLEGLTLPSAVEAFNRSIRAARNFLLQLHGQPSFIELGLLPFAQNAHRLYRNGGSEALTAQVEWFETTIAMCLYRHEGWDPQRVVFVCFDLLGTNGSDADLCIGACEVSREYTYGWVRAAPVDELDHPVLGQPSAVLPAMKSEVDGAWRFARKPWIVGQPEEDIAWALSGLKAATQIWSVG
jgi:hypothetical protein